MAKQFTESKIAKILKLAEDGVPVLHICREHGISSSGFYKWHAKYSGMDVSLIKQTKTFQKEISRLKQMHAEARMDIDVLKEILGTKVVKFADKRELAHWAVKNKSYSIAASCKLLGISVTCYNYKAKRRDENELIRV